MDDVTIARALHVLSVVLWIGGVGFVTTVLLPTVLVPFNFWVGPFSPRVGIVMRAES
jgi:uncharacterized membrane protein